ncbi:hypothetical protein BYT27DRAFT_7205138, partial [Phlegmacium glaucopus]
MHKNHTHGGSAIKRMRLNYPFVFDLLGICSAKSSCRYELKNGLSVVGEFSWHLVNYIWTCITGKLRSYSSQPTFTSISRKTRPFPLPFRFILQVVQGHACNPGLNKPMNLRGDQ